MSPQDDDGDLRLIPIDDYYKGEDGCSFWTALACFILMMLVAFAGCAAYATASYGGAR